MPELLKSGNKTVTVLSRASSSSTFPDGVAVKSVDYDDEVSLTEALEGQQFLIITLSASADPQTHGKIIRAAGKAGVPHVMPNIYTGDYIVGNDELAKEIPMAGFLRPIIQDIESVGASAWTVLVTGLWYEFSLASPPDWLGFDLAQRKVVFFDNGDRKMNLTTWKQSGRAVASLLDLPLQGSDKASLEGFKNRPVFVSSFFVSQRDVLDSIHRVSGTTDADWTITYEKSADRVSDGFAALAQGDLKGLAKATYSRLFYPGQDGVFEHKLDNEVLGLPKDDLDEATGRALEMVKNGWAPF